MLAWPEIIDRHLRGYLLDPPQSLDAIDPRHPNVQKDEIRGVRFDHFQRLGPFLGFPHFIPFIPQDSVQGLADPIFIVNDQNLLSHEFNFREKVFSASTGQPSIKGKDSFSMLKNKFFIKAAF
jgi:hypothetical protein